MHSSSELSKKHSFEFKIEINPKWRNHRLNLFDRVDTKMEIPPKLPNLKSSVRAHRRVHSTITSEVNYSSIESKFQSEFKLTQKM